ncbi:MAG: hypothetical protein ACK5ED_03850, partial [Gemmatimonadota bacterium]
MRSCLLRAALLVACSVTGAAAQAGAKRPCVLEFTGVVRQGVLTTSMRVTTMADGAKHTYISGGVDATCRGQGNRLLADSAEHYGDRKELILISKVRYTDERMRLDADRMVYFLETERLVATGSVKGTSAGGARFTGPELTYLRSRPGVRSVTSWRAPGRPTVRLATARTDEVQAKRLAASPADSMDVTADVVWSENDSLVWARGRVVMDRHDLQATADSAFLDQGTEHVRLRRSPRIVGTGERAFIMVGREIDLWSRTQALERVLATGEARVDGDSVVLRSDTVDVRIVDEQMDRVMAWGTRAFAEAQRQQMEADSIEMRLPKQVLEQVQAFGRAMTRGEVDTARITSPDPDWIAGDTVIARFETAPRSPTDTTSTTRLTEVQAVGSARAFQQLASAEGGKDRPNLSYNRGRVIVVRFAAGEGVRVDVQARASGLYREPVSAPPAPTAATVPGPGRR